MLFLLSFLPSCSSPAYRNRFLLTCLSPQVCLEVLVISGRNNLTVSLFSVPFLTWPCSNLTFTVLLCCFSLSAVMLVFIYFIVYFIQSFTRLFIIFFFISCRRLPVLFPYFKCPSSSPLLTCLVAECRLLFAFLHDNFPNITLTDFHVRVGGCRSLGGKIFKNRSRLSIIMFLLPCVMPALRVHYIC